MKRKSGFTLIELLVAIAIIAILAGIVIPNVNKYLTKGRMVSAMSEIGNIETALEAMLIDVKLDDFSGTKFFSDLSTIPQDPADIETAIEIYSEAFYVLLRQGRNGIDQLPAEVVLQDGIAENLGTAYMTELSTDPWKQPYRIYPGPWRSDPVVFRVLERDNTVPGQTIDSTDGDEIPLTGDDGIELDPEILVGYPAPRDQVVYIYSTGKNLESNQYFNEGYDWRDLDLGPDFVGGGDDINNWSNVDTWDRWYN